MSTTLMEVYLRDAPLPMFHSIRHCEQCHPSGVAGVRWFICDYHEGMLDGWDMYELEVHRKFSKEFTEKFL